MVNILSIDLEGSIEGKSAIYKENQTIGEDKSSIYEINKNLEIILEFFDHHKVKATFFILSRIIQAAPEIGHKILSEKHEIASHGYRHVFVDRLPESKINEYIYKSKALIEDKLSIEVQGFRAPFFSVCNKKEKIFDLLIKNGFIYDSSIFPVTGHDLYGCNWKHVNTPIKMRNGLVEMPMSTINILGKNIPTLGGGYLRLFPLIFSKYSISHLNRNSKPGVIYMHPYEIGENFEEYHESKFLQKIRFYRNIGKTTRYKLSNLFDSYQFSSHINFLKENKFL